MSEIKLMLGDCLERMKEIPDRSVDMVLCDLPYGTTACKWYNVIPFERLWEHYKRVAKNNGAILLFGIEPFSSFLRISNIKEYKYDWYWEKERLTNVFQVKRRPGKTIENISVFYKNSPTYNPQKNNHYGKKVSNKIGDNARFSIVQANNNIKPKEYIDDGMRFPTQIIRIKRDTKKIHPTQKPVTLLEYLIKTYTNEGEMVLDNCMGSGSTGVACLNTGRNFIGIELDENYFEIARNRIESCLNDIGGQDGLQKTI